MKENKAIILGAGMTGLAAGLVSGLPVYEATDTPGGICSSYYVRPGEKERLHTAPADGEAYRFEIGGGHWVFGGDPVLNHFMNSIVTLNRYARISSVYFHKADSYVPYPIQNSLGYVDKTIALKALTEMSSPSVNVVRTMEDWLFMSFGKTLTDLFFAPFHDLYTAGLWKRIAPQDSYKSPVNLKLALQGAFEKTPAVGYNTDFLYPAEGLDILSRRMAAQCNIIYAKRAVRIDPGKKEVFFSDGSVVPYDSLVCTLPLNRILEMSGLMVDAQTAPYSSVLVLNLGARRGKKCPPDHWLYNPDATSGFHRVGFYSNVDASFLPASSRKQVDRVSIYIERAYPGDKPEPSNQEVAAYANAVVKELQDWDYISDVEVVDPTWIEVAYTWSWPESRWKEQALDILQKHDIFPVGRYARWNLPWHRQFPARWFLCRLQLQEILMNSQEQTNKKNQLLHEINNNPGDFWSCDRLGELYRDEFKDAQEAIKWFQESLRRRPIPWPCDRIGEIYAGPLKEYVKAVAWFSKAAELDPANFQSCNRIGELYRDRLNDPYQALHWFEEFLRRRPAPWTTDRVAEIYKEIFQDYEKAIYWYKRSLEIMPGSYWSCDRVAEIYRDIYRDPDQAIAWFQRSIQINPIPWTHERVAEIYKDQVKDYSEAIKWFERVTQLDRRNSTACDQIMEISLFELKNHLQAEHWLQESIARNPMTWPPERVAEVYRDCFQDYQKAEDWFIKAANENPRNYWVCNRLAEFYRDRMKDQENAKKWLKEAGKRYDS